MSLVLQVSCDKIMDEFGSTCATRSGAATANVDEAAAYWIALGWVFTDAKHSALCPVHARLAGFPGAPRPAAPKPSSRDRAFGTVVPIPSSRLGSGRLPED